MIIVVMLFCEIFSSLAVKNEYTVKLESVQRTYVNNKLLDYTADTILVNKTCNFINMTIKFKFIVTENLLFETTCARITRNNRTFVTSKFKMFWKDTLSMEQFGVDSIWRDYTLPPLTWPPRVNITYRTVGWKPDENKFPRTLFTGKLKATLSLTLKNHTKLYSSDWLFNVFKTKV